jgi:hypothetical protein
MYGLIQIADFEMDFGFIEPAKTELAELIRCFILPAKRGECAKRFSGIAAEIA